MSADDNVGLLNNKLQPMVRGDWKMQDRKMMDDQKIGGLDNAGLGSDTLGMDERNFVTCYVSIIEISHSDKRFYISQFTVANKNIQNEQRHQQ